MPSAPTITAYIALGANLGDREANIRAAVDALDATPGVRVTRTSSPLENPAVGGPPDSPPFLNGVIAVETTCDPHALFQRMRQIERDLGRARREKWEPRPIDLDLLFFGDWVIESADLTVPHPLMHLRDFVLIPLHEIAPAVVHPTLLRTPAQMLAELHVDNPPRK